MVISVMESIGTILKHERERRGLSVQEVFESTKITVPNVEALELDRFESFPNKVYARAFLRDYANFLDLDSGALLQRYEAEWFVAPEIVLSPSLPLKKTSSTAWVAVILLTFVIAGAGYYYWFTFYSDGMIKPTLSGLMQGKSSDYTTNSAPGVPAQNLASKDPQLPITNNVQPDYSIPIESAKPVTPAVTKPTALPAKPVVTGLMLTVTALKQDVWIRVTGDDDRRLFEQELKSGQSKSWSAKYKFRIRCGKLYAVQVKLNGVPVKLDSDPNDHTVGVAVFKLKDIQTAPKSASPIAP